MFIIYKIYQPKIICKDGGSCFYKNKYRRLEIKKKSVFSISEIPNFSYMGFFQKMLNVSSEHSFKYSSYHFNTLTLDLKSGIPY